MRFFAALFLFVLGALPAFGAEPGEAISKETVLKAIAAFRRDPTSELGRGSAAVIVRFANDSPEVLVNLSEKPMPWTEAKPPLKEGPLLFAAFVAGNVRAQLARGAAKDDSLAGVEQVIETYRKLQEADPEFKVPGVERLIDLSERDKLRDYLNDGDSA